jgi:hypothetical protein
MRRKASDSQTRKTLPCLALLLLATTLTAKAQWDIEGSHTTASLRGIHNVGGGVAWASGTEGTVLRTEDGGYLWQTCATPPGAEKLDFRGIQAFDENTAIVMSSGKGDLSRLYKTTDGCRTWKLLFTNPDKEGFWDAIQFDKESNKGYSSHDHCFGAIVGDPIDGFFPMFLTFDCGEHWERQLRQSPKATEGEGLFAASNSCLEVDGLGSRSFVTGSSQPRVVTLGVGFPGCVDMADPNPPNILLGDKPFTIMHGEWRSDLLPTKSKIGQSAGAFSIANGNYKTVVVGGDYQQNVAAAWYERADYPFGFTQAQTPPHGYRSAVAYDPTTKTWITVGPNGTDISHDDGRNWTPLKPSAAEPQDADKNWNALSLPFVVGPHGRIGKLRDNAIPTEASSKESKAKTE